MNDKDVVRLFVKEIKNKFFIIIITSLITATGLAAEKYFTLEPIAYINDDIIAERMLRLDITDITKNPMPDKPSNPVVFVNDMPKGLFIISDVTFQNFIQIIDDNFDFTRFNKNWNNMKYKEKWIWLSRHIITKNFEPGVYTFAFQSKNEDMRDFKYAKENIDSVIDVFVEFSQEQFKKAEIGELVLIDSISIIPEGVEFSRDQIIIKYTIVGATLGAIIGFILIIGLTLRKLNYD